jgi:hypothetical protein
VAMSKGKSKMLISVFTFFIILLISNHFYPLFLVNIYYYFTNGQLIALEHYRVNLPFPQWVLNGKNKYLFIVSSDKDNFAEIAIDYRNIGIEYLLNACNHIQKKYKTYKNISGMEYLCDQTELGLTLYFLSDDSFFFLVARNYHANDDNAALYKTLFDSVIVVKDDNISYDRIAPTI